MKKILLISLVFFGVLAENSNAHAQFPAVTPKLYGASPFQDSLWTVDTTNFSIIERFGPTLAGFTITGMNGMAFDPETYQTYIIMKVSGVSGRVLGTVDLSTGVCTQIGNLGDNFSSITFDDSGQLWGATGDGATAPESLYLIDKATAAKTLMYAMGNGADGEVILYNRADDHMYHWSGNGTVVFEKWPLSNVSYTPTNIPTSGTVGGETFGTMYVSPNYILVSNISSAFNRVSPTGTYAGQFGSNPDDLRGVVMPPQFAISDLSVCSGYETVYIGAGGLQLFDSIVYNWGDGASDVQGVATPGGSHNYAVAGDYTVYIEVDNGVHRDTIKSFNVHVDASPVVVLSGDTHICSGEPATLTGAADVANQWYMDGVLLPLETSNTIVTDTAGVYNMVVTNAAGCADSAAVGVSLTDAVNPTVFIGNDQAVCDVITLDAGNPSATYLWSTSSTSQFESITTSGTYDVTVTDTNGCSASDTIQLIVNQSPIFSLGSDQSDCEEVILEPTTPVVGTYTWSDNSSGSTLTVGTSGAYALTILSPDNCSWVDSINVTIFGLPSVTLSTAPGVICNYDPDVTLVGTPAGGTFSGPSVTGSAFDPSIGNGNHDVFYEFTDGNGCTGFDTLTLVVDGCLGVAENTVTTLIVYPNPSTGEFTLDIPVNGAVVQVTDVFGKLVYNNRFEQNGVSTIQLDENANGTYFVTLTTPEGARSVARLVLAGK
ncbi:MAG: T9SS type A sorting domain-containing protein [Bacteroidota bacterium]